MIDIQVFRIFQTSAVNALAFKYFRGLPLLPTGRSQIFAAAGNAEELKLS